jgi:hypothetical protein
MTTHTTWNALMHYAKAVGEARKYGTSDDIAQAETNLSEYEQLVKKSDGMILPPYSETEK